MELEEKLIALEYALGDRLRKLGVVLHDDAGNRIKPGGPEEIRVLRQLSRSCVQRLEPQEECQTPAVGSAQDETTTKDDSACCANEKRNLDGGCDGCGDPRL